MIVIFSDPLPIFYKTQFSILNANIRGMITNLDNFKFFLDDLNNNFPIIGVTENWLKPHNVDSYFIEGYVTTIYVPRDLVVVYHYVLLIV